MVVVKRPAEIRGYLNNNGPIGYVVDQDTGTEALTRRFTIEYSKEKGTHIVQRYEDDNSK